MQSEHNSVTGLSALKRALLAIEDLQARLAEVERARKEPIAVIGIGCRFPGGENPEAFWTLLQRGGDAITEVPGSRWLLSDYSTNGRATKWGGFLKDIDQFDPEFFGISPREAHMMDPQQRILLEVVWEALENAAQGPADLVNGKTGVFMGFNSDEYSQRVFCRGDLSNFNAYLPTGIARSVAAGRISYVLGIEGPNFSLDTACSSSLVAVHNACLYLRSGECRMALAGGATVILSPEIVHSFANAHMMSPDGRCKAFDSRADGFVRSEGCGVVVLKRLSDAIADRDRILAVIRGSAINQDGHSAGLTVPNVNAQEAVIREALAAAGVRPGEVQFIEAHGTGTSLGDPIEARALARVFGSERPSDNPLVVGSVKTNVGHLEAAAGISGLIKTVLALQHQQIPPNLHYLAPNPHVDWAGMPVELPIRCREWRRGTRPRIGGVSSFGFSGTNAHVVVEEAPLPAERASKEERPLHVLTISARTPEALEKNVGQYAEALAGESIPLADLCFSANACHAHFASRLAVAGASAAEIRSRLLAGVVPRHTSARDGLRPVFLFPGQGSQYPGMSKELYDAHPEFRRSLDRCAELLRSELSEPLLEVLWGNATRWLDETAYTQPALFSVEFALAELWRSWGIEPAAVLGHSVGEYAAACVAGVYSLEDGLKLIAARGRLMQSVAGSGQMTVAFTTEERARESLHDLEKRASVAAVNAPEAVVISGYGDAIEVAEGRLRAQGIRLQRLPVSHAFHSPQMDEVADRFAAVSAEFACGTPQVKWISSKTGRLIGRGEINSAYWRSQVREPVRFASAMETLGQENHVFLEVGPGAALSSLGQQSVGGSERLWLASLRKGSEWKQILDTLSHLYMRGAEVNWKAFDRPYDRRRTGLPAYPFERKTFWFESPQPAKPVSSMPPPRPEPSQDAPVGGQEVSPRSSLFEIVWEPAEPAARPNHAFNNHDFNNVDGDWLVVADRTGVAQDLCARLLALGAKPSLISPSDDVKAAASSRAWGNVVMLGALDVPSPELLTSPSLEAAQAVLCKATLGLVHGLKESRWDRAPRLWLITRGAQGVEQNDAVAVGQSTQWGLAQSIGEEYPEWNCTCVDLDPEGAPTAAALCDELLAGDAEEHIALRRSGRFVMRIVPAASPLSAAPISPDATYLLTGGCGALGQRVARWLIEQGAQTLVLAGRGATPAAAQDLFDWAGAKKVRILARRADVSRREDVAALFSEIADSLPPLRGIVHAAGVLDDGVLAEQSWERFAPVLAPKVLGAWTLHQFASATPLDFFVLFSSVGASIGSPGQANYAAANAFLDSLAHYRRQRGLPATSIAWGAWAEGMAARDQREHRRQSLGVYTISTEDALEWFGHLTAGAPAHVLAGAFDWNRLATRYHQRRIPGRFRRLISEPAVGADHAASSNLLEKLAGLTPLAGTTVIREYLQGLAVRVLGLTADRTIDPLQPLSELGLDSLMAVEFRNTLSAALQRNLPATLLFSYPTLDEVTQFVAGQFWAAPARPVQAQETTTDDILDHLEQASEEELDRLFASKFGDPR